MKRVGKITLERFGSRDHYLSPEEIFQPFGRWARLRPLDDCGDGGEMFGVHTLESFGFRWG